MPLDKFVANSFLPYSQQLYSQLYREYAKSNCFVSPLSIYCGLSLAMCGTDGKSLQDMLKVLRITDSNDYASIVSQLGSHLNEISHGDKDKTLVLANGLFLESTFESNEHFQKALEKHFHTQSHQVSFKSNAEVTRKQINEFIANNTGKKITELMPYGSIDSRTCLVLANAIYFKGTWEDVFHREATMKAPFQTLHDGEVEVPMMKKNACYAMADLGELNATALKIPFKCHEMLIVLPHESAGLVKLMETISDPHQIAHFNAIFNKERYSMDRVELHLPKFKLGGGESLDLKKVLSAVGLEDLFEPGKANFTRITKCTDLYISAMFHQAVIEVDEEGAEAAAATGMSIAPMCLVPDFNVNHPFLFFIVTETGVPVFMGHVINPLA